MELFDLDGTLIDSTGMWLQVDIDFLARRGLPHTKEYADAVATTIFPVAAQFAKDYFHLSESPQAIMDEWRDMAQDAYATKIPLKPGVRAFLEQERCKGKQLAIATATMPELCHLVLARHGLSDFFRDLVFAQELGMEKSDPEFFRTVVKQLGFTPSDCTMYEDAPVNCVAAKAAGLTVVGVADPFYALGEPILRKTCDRFIESFEALLEP